MNDYTPLTMGNIVTYRSVSLGYIAKYRGEIVDFRGGNPIVLWDTREGKIRCEEYGKNLMLYC